MTRPTKDELDRFTATKPRRKRNGWVVDGNLVRQVTGYSCAPNNPSQWWCPEAGNTLYEQFHLFKNERDAIDAAIAKIDKDIVDQTKALVRLTKKRHKIK